MGAETFYHSAKGLSAKEAYKEFTDGHMDEYGQRSGMQHKGGLQKVTLPSNVKTEKQIWKHIETLIEKAPYDDKWGPAFYIEVLNTGKIEVQEITGVTVKKPENKGAAQWKTVYVVTYYDNNSMIPSEKRVEKATQAEALDAAKKLAMNVNVYDVKIVLEKKLTSKTNLIAKVEPKYKKVKKPANTYYFFGWRPS